MRTLAIDTRWEETFCYVWDQRALWVLQGSFAEFNIYKMMFLVGDWSYTQLYKVLTSLKTVMFDRSWACQVWNYSQCLSAVRFPFTGFFGFFYFFFWCWRCLCLLFLNVQAGTLLAGCWPLKPIRKAPSQAGSGRNSKAENLNFLHVAQLVWWSFMWWCCVQTCIPLSALG